MRPTPIDWPSPTTMSAPISPGERISAQRHRLGHHRDQQRALLVRARGELGEVADPAQYVRILDDDAARLAVDRVEQAGGVRLRRQLAAARVSSTSPVNRAIVLATET